MFKRPRLSAANRLVNAPAMLSLLFLAGACGGPEETPATQPPPEVPEVVETGLVLPAVWSTRDLGTPISNIAIAGALGSTIAVAYEDGGLQFVNLEGERMTQKADLDVNLLGDGRYLLLSGVAVTLFPGTNSAGEMKLYIHGGQLPEPLVYDLAIGQAGAIAGLCTAPPDTEADGVLRLAFWTAEHPHILHSGRIVEVGEDLVFLPDSPVAADRPITACLHGETGATVFSAPVSAAAILSKRGHSFTATLDNSGNLAISGDDGRSEPITVRNGITIRMPALPIAMAGTGDTRGGGYPGGVLVVAGEGEDGDTRVVFIDPSKLTLATFGYQIPDPRQD